jgi:hypothetical protein
MRRKGCEQSFVQSFVQSRAPATSGPERARGGCTNACTTPAHCSRSLKALHQGGRDMRAIQRLAGSKHDARAHWAQGLCPNCHTPWPVSGILRLSTCSSQVHTTPKSAKGMSCSSSSAGKRSNTGRRSPPATMCLNTRWFRCFPGASGFSLPPFDVIFVHWFFAVVHVPYYHARWSSPCFPFPSACSPIGVGFVYL